MYMGLGIIKERQLRGKELLHMRLLAGLSKTQLAKLSTVSRPTIDCIEKGSIGWNIDTELLYVKAIKEYMQSKQQTTI